MGGLLTASAASALDPGMPWSGPATVRKVFLANQNPTWPKPDIDLEQERREIEAQLAELQQRHPGQIQFTGGEMLRSAAGVSAWIARAALDDVILAFNLTSGLGSLTSNLLSTGRPTLLISRPYSGHSWADFSRYRQKGQPADVLATSNYGDLDPYVAVFHAIHFMRNSKVLLVGQPSATARGTDFTGKFGTKVAACNYTDLKAVYEASDLAQARSDAGAYVRGALRVVEPSRQEVVDSMRLYNAMREYLRQQSANAIAIDCLGGFRRNELPAYPCVGFALLNDTGMFGVCECDLDSAVTQVLVTSLSNMPGFISDPVFDTSRNEVIHAHCVAASRLAGLDGPKSPYILRSHLEDNKGVSLQVLAPPSGPVTVARFAGAARFMLSTADVLGNVDYSRGCRTKIRTHVSDARKFLDSYGPGLHRVLFYGNHVAALERFCHLTATEIVREL
jgi:hypothetical protein